MTPAKAGPTVRSMTESAFEVAGRDVRSRVPCAALLSTPAALGLRPAFAVGLPAPSRGGCARLEAVSRFQPLGVHS